MKVDVAATEVEASLSQWSAADGCVHSLLHCLSLVEQNYNISEQELLAIQLVLEECSTLQFEVWTNHINMEHLHLEKNYECMSSSLVTIFSLLSLLSHTAHSRKNTKLDVPFSGHAFFKVQS